MLKHTSLIVAGALVLGMGISTASSLKCLLWTASPTRGPVPPSTPAAIPTSSRPIRRPASGPASLTGRAWVPMCRVIPTSPAMIPRTAASASSPFRGKMPSSGKVPRVPSVVTGHPQGGALRNPSPPDTPKTRHLRFRPRGIFLFACKWSMIGLPRTGPSGDTATVGGSEGPAGWEVNRARPNTPSRR